MHFVYKLDNLFWSIRVSDENSSVTPAIQNFNNLLLLRTFFASSMHHSKPRHQLSTLSDFISFFHAFTDFLSYKTLRLKSISNELLKGWKLAWYHHFIHIACARKLRGLRQKLDALRVQTRQSLLKSRGFRRKLICYKRHFIFLTYYNTRLFVRSLCTIQSHVVNFQPFVPSFAIFHAVLIWFELNDP